MHKVIRSSENSNRRILKKNTHSTYDSVNDDPVKTKLSESEVEAEE